MRLTGFFAGDFIVLFSLVTSLKVLLVVSVQRIDLTCFSLSPPNPTHRPACPPAPVKQEFEVFPSKSFADDDFANPSSESFTVQKVY